MKIVLCCCGCCSNTLRSRSWENTSKSQAFSASVIAMTVKPPKGHADSAIMARLSSLCFYFISYFSLPLSSSLGCCSMECCSTALIIHVKLLRLKSPQWCGLMQSGCLCNEPRMRCGYAPCLSIISHGKSTEIYFLCVSFIYVHSFTKHYCYWSMQGVSLSIASSHSSTTYPGVLKGSGGKCFHPVAGLLLSSLLELGSFMKLCCSCQRRTQETLGRTPSPPRVSDVLWLHFTHTCSQILRFPPVIIQHSHDAGE